MAVTTTTTTTTTTAAVVAVAEATKEGRVEPSTTLQRSKSFLWSRRLSMQDYHDPPEALQSQIHADNTNLDNNNTSNHVASDGLSNGVLLVHECPLTNNTPTPAQTPKRSQSNSSFLQIFNNRNPQQARNENVEQNQQNRRGLWSRRHTVSGNND